MSAAAKEHAEVVTKLMNRVASLESTDAYGRTPL
jgi:hypothetical protein